MIRLSIAGVALARYLPGRRANSGPVQSRRRRPQSGRAISASRRSAHRERRSAGCAESGGPDVRRGRRPRRQHDRRFQEAGRLRRRRRGRTAAGCATPALGPSRRRQVRPASAAAFSQSPSRLRLASATKSAAHRPSPRVRLEMRRFARHSACRVRRARGRSRGSQEGRSAPRPAHRAHRRRARRAPARLPRRPRVRKRHPSFRLPRLSL